MVATGHPDKSAADSLWCRTGLGVAAAPAPLCLRRNPSWMMCGL